MKTITKDSRRKTKAVKPAVDGIAGEPQDHHNPDIEQQKNSLKKTGRADPGQRPEKQHGGWRIDGREPFMVDLLPDFGSLPCKERQRRIVRRLM